jgi:putative flippase GtrA
MKRFGVFSLVGLLGIGLQLSLLTLLTKKFGLPTAVATAVAVEITLLHNFLWHQQFTWSDRRPTELRQRFQRLWRFHLGNGLVSLVGNTTLNYLLVDRMKFAALPSALASIAVCSIINFMLADRWVYARI